jgi:hypothetical protein
MKGRKERNEKGVCGGKKINVYVIWSPLVLAFN